MNPNERKTATPRPGLFRRTLRRWGLPILALGVVGSVALMTATYLKVKPMYRASSFLRVAPATINLFGIPPGGDALGPYLQTQVQLIRSPNVLIAAGTNPKAAVLPRIQTAPDVVIELNKALSVGVVPETYLIEVGVSSPSAYEAATIVNAVVDAFIESNSEWSEGMTRSQITSLERYLGELRDQSDDLERQWRDLVAKGHDGGQVLVKEAGTDGTTKTSAQGAKRSPITLEEYGRIRQVLFELDLDVRRAEATAAERKAEASRDEQAPGSKADAAWVDRLAERRLQADREVVELSARVAEERKHLDAARRASASSDDPAVQAAAKRHEELTTRYDELKAAKLATYRAGILDEAGPEKDLRKAEARASDLRAQRAAIQARFDQFELETPNRAADEVGIALVKERRAHLLPMQEIVNRRLEQLKFEAKGESRVRPVNVAVPPGKPISDPRKLLMALAPVAAFPLAFAFFAGVEAVSGSRRSAAEEEPAGEA